MKPGRRAAGLAAGVGRLGWMMPGRGHPDGRLRAVLLALSLSIGTTVLGGCSINPPLDLAGVVRGQPRLQLPSVPFFPQADYQCGPAALAGVLGAAGVEVSAEALSAQVYLPGRRGSLQLELLGAARRAGRIPYIIDDTVPALFAQLEAGRPVLVLQNLRTRGYPLWHYAVLLGFDVASNRVYLNSGLQRGLSMKAPSFLRTWSWGERWAMVVLRPGELPAGADPLRFAEAVASFAAVSGAPAAEPAWRAALARWPENSRPHLAMGNDAYAGGERLAAVDHYRRGLQISPGDPALSNNLASVLGELGCPRAAEVLLQPSLAALEKQSAWRAVMVETLAQLAQRQGSDPGRCAGFKQGAPGE